MKRIREHPPVHLLGPRGHLLRLPCSASPAVLGELASCTPPLFVSTRDSFPPEWPCVIRKQTQLRPRGQMPGVSQRQDVWGLRFPPPGLTGKTLTRSLPV